jgi:hypothetical protein
LALIAFVLFTKAAGHKKGEDHGFEEKGMRKNDYSSVQKPSPRHSSEMRSNEPRRVNSRKIVERVEYEFEYASSEEEAPRRRDRRPPPPPPRRQHGYNRGYDDCDCYADNEDVDDYGIPIYFFVFTSRPPRPRNGYFVFAFFGGQPPFWFRNKPLTSKFNVATFSFTPIENVAKIYTA